MNRRSGLMIFIWILFLGGIALATPSSPSEVWVDDDFIPSIPGWGITLFDNIQDGVDAVAPLGIVYVSEGIYAEHVTIQKPIELSGNDKYVTIVDGGGTGAVVTVLNGGGGTRISGFTLKNSGTTWGSAGVRIANVDGTVVSGNLIQEIYTGIHVDNSSYHALTSNDIMNSILNGIGIYCTAGDSREITVSGNSIGASGRAGVMIYGSGFSSSDNTITGNIILASHRAGIYLCGENGFFSSGNTLSENVISGSKIGEGIFLQYTRDSTISNNTVTDNKEDGITLAWESNDNTIFRNVISGNEIYGINAYQSHNLMITENRCLNNGFGIYLSSDEATLERNLVSGFQYGGIWLYGAFSNSVRNNIIQGSTNGSGLMVIGLSNSVVQGNCIRDVADHGIYITQTVYALISENVVTDCRNGMGVYGSNNLLATGNTLSCNLEYGLLSNAYGNEKNAYFHNNFIDNALANAFDSEISAWDDGYPNGGNYWSDYSGADLDGDGIGDSPHPIPGGSNQDLYPLMSPRGGGALWVDTHLVSAASGGTVNFTVHASATNAGRYYLLLGGMSGTEPGIPLPGGMATLPVNWDVYTDLVWANINTPFFSDFLGFLDLQGTAAARMQLPPIMPTMAGSRMYLAYTCNNPFDVASNPVTIQIVD